MTRLSLAVLSLTIGLLLPGFDALAATDPVLRIEAAAHTGPIRRLAVDAAGTRIVTTSDDKTARVWDIRTRQLLSVLRISIGPGETGKLYGAAISPEGAEVAIGGSTSGAADGVVAGHRIYVFNLETGRLSRVIDARDGDVRRIVWSPDGRFLVASYAGSNGVRVFARTGEELYSQKFSGSSYGAAVSARGDVAVPAFDGKVHLYAVAGQNVQATGVIETSLHDPVSASFSPDGDSLAVGYHSRSSGADVQVDVFDVASRQRVKRFLFTDVPKGNLMNVVWSRDGTAIHAAGTGYRGRSEYIVKRIAWPSGATSETEVGANTVTDLAALADGSVAFSTFEPAWGVLKEDRVLGKQRAPVFDLRGAGQLLVNAHATQVSWKAPGAGRLTFDLARRTLSAGAVGEERKPRVSSGNFRNARWEDTFAPEVNGRAIALAPGEVARAFAVLPDDTAAVMATSWSLRMIDPSGAEIWRRSLATEIRAVNATDDSQVIVSASADGTIQWWRTSDGTLLLSLFVVNDGRWVLWTERGHYDASTGAESLVGWHVNRADGHGADFFSVAHFRDRFYRPDVVDRVLALRDPALAFAQANESLQWRVDKSSRSQLTDRVETMLAAAHTSPAQLPPALNLLTPALVETSKPMLRVEFSAYSREEAPVSSVRVLVDGRPVEQVSYMAPGRADGREVASISLMMPARDAVVQVFATNAYGVSEPLTVRYHWRSPRGSQAPSSAPSRPTLYVLAIGVSKYANPEYDLSFADKDALEFSALLKRQEGLFYERVVVRALTNAQATHAAVLDELGWLRRSVTSDDVAIVFLSGHGVADVAHAYYFLPHDADLGRSPRSLVSEDHLRDALMHVRGKVLFFIDTCHAGKAIGRLGRRDVTLLANRLSSPESGVVVFSSSDGFQDSLEDESWGNGAFTKGLISGLSGQADFRGEGVVTFKGLDYFVSNEVRGLTGGRQTPVTIVPVGMVDFPIAKTVN